MFGFMFSYLLLSLAYLYPMCFSNPEELNVGAVFSSNHEQNEIAFKWGIAEANRMLSEFSVLDDKQYRLKPLIMNLETLNSFLASKQTCSLLKNKVITVLGPTDPVVADQTQAVCFYSGIPFLDMSPISLQQKKSHLTISLYPQHSTVAASIMDYIKKMSWNNLVIIYTQKSDLIKFSELLNNYKQKVYLKKIIFDGSEKYPIKYLQINNYFQFIVDIPYWHFTTFMKQVEYYNMTNQFYSYLFTNWDTQLLNLENFTFNSAANITTLALFPIQNQKSKDKGILEFQKKIYEVERKKHNSHIFTFLTTETALIYESMRLFAKALIKTLKRNRIHLSAYMSCDFTGSWAVGVSLYNAFSQVELDSSIFAGRKVEVNERGWIRNYHISISRLKNRSYFENYGFWSNETKIIITSQSMSKQEVNYEISKQTFRVVTIIDAPFVLSKRRDANGITPKDPDAWDGFCIQLLKKLAEDLKFNYTIEEVADRQYGSLIEEGDSKRWNGLVGALMTHKADLSVSSLTITYDRERVIDFTTPFMNLGISLLFQRPKLKPIRLWAFLEPLSKPVWGYVIMSYISVSLVLFVIGRFSPHEWYNPSPCQVDCNFHSNQFNILNSMWFTIGSFMQQGTDIIPKATSTRIVAGMWWFFTLIIISSYTANLAAFLTLARMKVPIENAEDLSKQKAIKFGTVIGGSTFQFFKKSTFPAYQKMYKTMKYNPHLLVKSNEEGIKRISQEYIFILESTTNEFYTRRNCQLVRIGGLLDSKGYGIGLAQGSRYRDAFSESILKLQKAQTIEMLRQYFWRKFNNSAECPPPEDKELTSSLGIKETGGVFVMLITGAIIAIIMAIIEMTFKALKVSKSNKTPLCLEVKNVGCSNIKKICDRDGGSEEEDDESLDENGQMNSVSSSSPKAFPTTTTAAAVSDVGGGYRGVMLHETNNNNIDYNSKPRYYGNSNNTSASVVAVSPAPPALPAAASSGGAQIKPDAFPNNINNNYRGLLSQTTSFDYGGGSSGGGGGGGGGGGPHFDIISPPRPSSPLYHLPPGGSSTIGSVAQPYIHLQQQQNQPQHSPLSPPASIIGVAPSVYHPPPQVNPNQNHSFRTVFEDSHNSIVSPAQQTPLPPPSYDTVASQQHQHQHQPQQSQQQPSQQVRVKKVAC